MLLHGYAALLSVILFLTGCPAEGADVVIGRDYGWRSGLNYPEYCMVVGDTLVFNYQAFHDVYAMPSMTCDFSVDGAVKLANVTDSPYRHTATESGVLYFACSIGRGVHCGDGQLVKVIVEANECSYVNSEASEHDAHAIASDGCSSISDRSQCCNFKDGRADYDGQLCVPSVSGSSYSTGSVCEPQGWMVANDADLGEPCTEEVNEGHCEERVEQPDGMFNITCYSPYVWLAPGQVVNLERDIPNPYPEGQTVAIHTRTTQLVREDGSAVPLNEVYVHHFLSALIGGNGAELAGREEPYLQVCSSMSGCGVNAKISSGMDSPETTFHLINTIGVDTGDWENSVLPCIECRCRRNDNTGGISCCRDCDTSAEPVARKYFLKYSMVYKEMTDDTHAVTNLGFDVANALGRFIEYDVPAADPDGGENQTYFIEITTMLGAATANNDLGWAAFDQSQDHVEALRCTAHQHIGGLGMAMYLADTGEKICEVLPQYGTEEGVVGNEKPYLVAMPDDDLEEPRIFSKNDRVRITSLYRKDAVRHTGVMALFQLHVRAPSVDTSQIPAPPPGADAGPPGADEETFQCDVGTLVAHLMNLARNVDIVCPAGSCPLACEEAIMYTRNCDALNYTNPLVTMEQIEQMMAQRGLMNADRCGYVFDLPTVTEGDLSVPESLAEQVQEEMDRNGDIDLSNLAIPPSISPSSVPPSPTEPSPPSASTVLYEEERCDTYVR
ncbi:hypothetical protein CYMTET_9065 [Cymbomonas tetramitiformis]|uniref:Uncharacterized protein n=1 Tax=Cymbomonas tetramitiformis TaxID=36881 RepID=A0AAE0GS97_9CHLO|nr:hypothetical protein CYMTET_9065 [Cymbomonas tetramitiformis]